MIVHRLARLGAAPRVLVPLLAVCSFACGRAAPSPTASGTRAPERTSGLVTVGSARLHYEVHGAGPVLLLMHGGLTSSEDFRPVIPAFARHFRVIVIDRRGHGRSSDTAEPFSYASMAEETKAALDRLTVDSAAVLGFSDGGVVGYHMAARYPALVRKLVAIGANHLVNGMTAESVDWIRTRLTVDGVARDFPSIERQYRALSPQPDNYTSFLRRTRELWLRDPYITREEIARIAVPVLFVVGDRDDVRVDHVVEMFRAVKGAELFVVPNSTHFLLFEKPDLVVPTVMEFLRR